MIRDAAQPIELELLAEKAASLGRANEALTAALTALANAEAALAAADPADRAELSTRRRELRAIAGERLWFLLVQRESIGVHQHETLWREYRVPAEVRLLAGPRPRR